MPRQLHPGPPRGRGQATGEQGAAAAARGLQAGDDVHQQVFIRADVGAMWAVNIDGIGRRSGQDSHQAVEGRMGGGNPGQLETGAENRLIGHVVPKTAHPEPPGPEQQLLAERQFDESGWGGEGAHGA